MGWIKCDERLPEKDDYYLTWFPAGFAMVLAWSDGWNCHNGSNRDKEIKTVIAWQPIEPFEEKK